MRLYGIVEQAYSQNPAQWRSLRTTLSLRLNSSKRTGDPAADLRRAVQKADSEESKRSTADRIERSMRAVTLKLRSNASMSEELQSEKQRRLI